MVQKLVDALNLLNGIHCSGREDITRMLVVMQKIEEVAREIKESEQIKDVS